MTTKNNNFAPLYGLILAGGQSSRMAQDKAMMQYHGKPQMEVCYDLLHPLCEATYISARSGQRADVAIKHLPHLFDTFEEAGPMAGILTAMQEHRHAAWLVVACDLPFLDTTTLEYLIANRNPQQLATCYQSSSCEFPEPLCAIYEPAIVSKLLENLQEGKRCPRKVLINSPVKMLQQLQSNSLDNANTPTDFEEAKRQLEQEA